jgi:hypothetical protein
LYISGACIPYRQCLLFKHDNIFNWKINIRSVFPIMSDDNQCTPLVHIYLFRQDVGIDTS